MKQVLSRTRICKECHKPLYEEYHGNYCGKCLPAKIKDVEPTPGTPKGLQVILKAYKRVRLFLRKPDGEISANRFRQREGKVRRTLKSLNDCSTAHANCLSCGHTVLCTTLYDRM